jgi:hypothetical protein
MVTKGIQIRQHRVVVNCADYLESQAEWLLDLIKEMDGEAPVEEGKRIQFGWSMLIFKRLGPDTLVVCEPDFLGDAFREVQDDVTFTLEVQARQNDLARQLKFDPVPALFKEKIVLAKGCLDIEHIYLERTPNPSAGDSGWYIGPVDDAEKDVELDAIYVYDLIRLRPLLLPVLCLPAGHLVVFAGDELETVLNPQNEKIFNREGK